MLSPPSRIRHVAPFVDFSMVHNTSIGKTRVTGNIPNAVKLRLPYAALLLAERSRSPSQLMFRFGSAQRTA